MIKSYFRSLFLFFVLCFVGMGFMYGQKTWYAINNVARDEAGIGWANFENWTEDPSAQVYYNPDSGIPGVGDNVVIRSGKEITLPADFSINAGIVTVEGSLYIEGADDDHELIALRGKGRVYIRGNKLPSGDLSHFIEAGPGGGTIIFQGNGALTFSAPFSAYNLEIDMSAGDKTVTFSNNITINGNFNLKRGRLLIGGSQSRTYEIKDNLKVESDGSIGVTSNNYFHNLIVWGDFKNYGSVKFSNAAQYEAATNGAVRLIFKGASNNEFIINGTTELYRLFIEKGDNDFYTLNVTSNNSDNFKLMGPYERGVGIENTESTGWERLPLVIRKGTLKLGSNIIIDKLGYLRNGTAPNEFFIPESAGLWINGAHINSGEVTSPESWQANGTGISVKGTLRMSAGSLTNPPLSSGIAYHGSNSEPSKLIIEGGEIFTTQVREYNNESYLNFSQSGGVIDFYTRTGTAYNSPVFNLPKAEQVFEMSGGEMIFRVANDREEDSHGIQILSEEGNYNVSGGTIKIFTPKDNVFQILSLAPFYNVEVIKGEGNNRVEFREHWTYPKKLYILNSLKIGTGTTVNVGQYELFLGKDLELNGSLSFSGGFISLMGNKDASLINNTSGNLNIPNLEIHKDRADAIVSLSGSNSFTISKLTLIRGDLDVVDKNVTIISSIELFEGNLLSSATGSIILNNGVTLNSSRGKDNSFGNLKLAAGANVSLNSHAKAKRVDFVGNGVFNIGIHNLEILEADYSAVTGWSTSKMFKTTGKASDGGLTLPVTLSSYSSNTDVQFFPLGTQSRYSYCLVYAKGNNINDEGYITVKPVEGHHPSVRDKGEVASFYYRISKAGLENTSGSEMAYKFLIPTTWGGQSYKGMVLKDQTWSEYGVNKDSEGNGITHLRFSLNTNLPLEGDYTVGNKSAFNQVTVYYSKSSGNWNDRNNWTTNPDHSTGSTNKIPASYDVAIIGGANGSNHNITLSTSNTSVSQVYIKGKSETDIEAGNPPTLTIAHNTSNHNIALIKGHGTIVHINNFAYYSDYTTINGDYSEFCNSTEAIIEFTGNGDGPRLLPPMTKIAKYPNLHISGSVGYSQFAHGNDLKVNGNLVVKNTKFYLPATNNGMISIGGDVIIDNSTLGFSTGYNHHMTIDGSLIFTGGGVFNGQSGGDEKDLFLKGDLLLGNGQIQFNNTQKINLVFSGDNSVVYSKESGGTANFYRVKINKPEGVKVDFQAPFSLHATANGASDNKPFLLQSGIAHLTHRDINLTFNSGGGDFKIPSGTKLIVDNGATVRASGNRSSLFLDGALHVDNGAKLLWEGSGGNHLKYSSSGNASILIGEDAVFRLGSQLYANSEGGILKFTHASATSDVQIATINAPLSTKAVFELQNEGSSFVQSEENSKIQILRAPSGQNPVTSIYFNPSSVTIASGSKFVLGNNGTTNFTLNAGRSMGGLDITGAASVSLSSSPLTLQGTLKIGEDSELKSNNLDLTLKGDFIVDGTYDYGFNTTSFSGITKQTVLGNPDFYNLSKSAGDNELSFEGEDDIEIENELIIERGSISTNDYNLVVKGDATSFEHSFIEGLEMGGSEMQLLSGGGEYGRLFINNDKNVMRPSQPDVITVSEELILGRGILDIGSNLFQLGKEAVISDGNGGNDFSESNMIQTFLSFTDAGIRKYFPSIDEPTTFIYPIGSQNKYTPLTMEISSIESNDGYIRVKAANEPHISIAETENVLQYYWTVDANGIEGFKSKFYMQAYPDDVIPADKKDEYIVARILSNKDEWNKLDITNSSLEENIFFDGENSLLVFNGYFFEGTNDLGISGDYTAGIESYIPDRIPTVISVDNKGDWNEITTWAVYDPDSGGIGEAGEGIPQNGPLGSIVYIREDVGITHSGRVAYRTVIEEGATLDIGSTINNRLGNVSGKGILRVESGVLPAGFYEDFTQENAGIFEFSGTGNYTVLSGINTVNSLAFTGSGERKIPNATIKLNGDFLIDGPAISMKQASVIQIGKDLIFNSGSIETSDDSNIEFNGIKLQKIKGEHSFTGNNGIHNITINNNAGIELLNDLEIKNHLQLNKGLINTQGSGSLYISNSSEQAHSGVSSLSYVNGPLYKFINANENFEFPLGKGGRYGPFSVNRVTAGGYWKIEYFNSTPPKRNQKGDIDYISNNEYWEVTAPVANASASLTLRWDDASGVNPDEFDVVSLNTDAGESEQWTILDKQSTDKVNKRVTTVSLTHNTRRYFSFGLDVRPVLNDYTWIGASSSNWFDTDNWYGKKLPSAATPVLITTLDVNPVPTRWPVISDNNASIAQTNDLTIEGEDASLTLNPGSRLTVNGDLSIAEDGGLKIFNQSGEGGMASLLTHGAISGKANVRLSLLTDHWFYLGSSISGATFGNFSPGDQGSGTLVNVYRDRWYSTYTQHNTTELQIMEGVSVYYPPNGGGTKELSYTGVLNNGEISREYVENRYQLMANPYPSFINWQDDDGWERDAFESTIWYRMLVGGAMTFITYNNSSVPGARLALYPDGSSFSEAEFALIAPMQSVYVRPTKAGATLTINNSARTHGLTTSYLKSSSGRSGDVIRIVSSNAYSRDGAVLYFASGSESGIDAGDSEKYFNEDVRIPEIYTQSEGKALAINGLPPLKDDHVVLPLSVRNGIEGEIILSFDLSYYYGDHLPYLYDNEKGVNISLVDTNEYKYNATDTGDDHTRFELHFINIPVGLDVDNKDAFASGGIMISGVKGKALVIIDDSLLNESDSANVEVFTINGQKFSETIVKDKLSYIDLPEMKGVYIVRVVVGEVVKSERVLN